MIEQGLRDSDRERLIMNRVIREAVRPFSVYKNMEIEL